MNFLKLGLAVVLTLFIFSESSFSEPVTYKIDPAHSQVIFKVKHFGISTVTGRFDNFEGNYTFDQSSVENSSVNAKIDATSVNTNNKKRDDHLKSDDFLNVGKFPEISFKSKEIKKGSSDGEFLIVGYLTLHGITKTIALETDLGGVVEKDPYGNKRSAFTATGEINRKDFGIEYNKLMEAGGLVVGDEVKIILEVEGIKASWINL